MIKINLLDSVTDRPTGVAMVEDRVSSRGVQTLLLALTVSTVNPRVGRSGNLLFGLFAFVLYYNMLNLGQNWIASGRYSMGGFMLALHGGAMLIGLIWLAKRHFNWARPSRRARPATTPHA